MTVQIKSRINDTINGSIADLKKKRRTANEVALCILLFLSTGKLCQTSPTPFLRQGWWNPYYYPTARSLSIPPTERLSQTSSTTSTMATTTLRPWLRPTALFSADRRASMSLNFKMVKDEEDMYEDKQDLNFSLGNATAIGVAVNEFIKSAEVLIRELLISTNTGLVRIIGHADQGVGQFQNRLRGSSLKLAFAGQKAAAQTYEALPPFVNRLIQRLIMRNEGRSREQLTAQLNDVVKNLRQLKKMFWDDFADHERDFHEVFQERFTQINQYLRVPELPRKPLAWYP